MPMTRDVTTTTVLTPLVPNILYIEDEATKTSKMIAEKIAEKL